jgi:ComF family protein
MVMGTLQTASSLLLDIVYPPSCISCGSGGRWWCEACRVSVERPSEHPCPRCLAVGQHAPCKGRLPFKGIVVLGFYHSKPLRRLIAELKYGGMTSLNRDVECFLLDRAASCDWEFPWRTDIPQCIQPVPLASPRLRDRGFNQSHVIADRLRDAWLPNTPIADALDRMPGRITQASIRDAAAREANVRDTFIARGPVPGSVLLVDDVVTTGSTAAEAARVLLGAGASRVYLAAVAIGQ